MKKYNKPEFYIEEFDASQAVAVTACTSQEVGSKLEVKSQSVSCGRSGSTETLFFDTCTHTPLTYGYYNAGSTSTDNKAYDSYNNNNVYSSLTENLLDSYDSTNTAHTSGYNSDYSGYIDGSWAVDSYKIYDGFYATWKKSDDKSNLDPCFGAITAAIAKILGYSG